jgi:dephospho-CoA kinase
VQKQTIKIGITGGLCSGKTLVGKSLEKYGVSNLDTTDTVMNLVATNPRFIEKAAEHFGEEVQDRQGRFSNKKMTLLLLASHIDVPFVEDMIYAKVRDEMKRFLYSPIGTAIRVVQYPLIYETKSDHLFDEVWTVTIDPEIQKERLMSRDDLSEFEAEERIRASLSQEIKTELSKRVIDNSGDRYKTEQQAMTALNDCKRKLLKPNLF